MSSGGGSAEFTKFCNFIGVYTMNCGGTNSNALHLASTCQGPDIASATFFNGYDCGGGNLVFDPIKSGACGNTGTAAIIPVPFYKLSLALGLDTSESECLNNHCELKNQIYDYLNAHRDDDVDYEEEALNFVSAVIDELTDTCETDFEVDFPNKVIEDSTFVNNLCLKTIYDTMGNAPTFNNYLQNFDGEFSVAHLKLSSSTDLPDDTNAQTSAPQNYIITITFNENNLDRPNLSIARTFIHEMIHAEIFRKLISVSQTSNIQALTPEIMQLLQNDYPGLYDYYLRWKNNIPHGMNLTSAQHQVMAQHYRDIIKQALIEFDDSHTQEVYEALSWIGLKNTIAWNSLSQAERNNIDQTIFSFENNNPNCQ